VRKDAVSFAQVRAFLNAWYDLEGIRLGTDSHRNMQGTEDCPVIDSRVCVDGNLAFVRYFGAVDGQEGRWVGLEWDEEARGKHDGTHAGRQYFQCRVGKLSGSFLRWEKYCQLLNVATNIVDALKTRYQDQAAMVNPEDRSDMFVSTSSHRKVPVELVLDGKEKPLDSLTQVVLSGMHIATVVRSLQPSCCRYGLSSDMN
jgi:tubulin-specific chaperone E